MKEYLSLAEAAELIGKSKETLWHQAALYYQRTRQILLMAKPSNV